MDFCNFTGANEICMKGTYSNTKAERGLCEPVVKYCRKNSLKFQQLELFPLVRANAAAGDVRVMELFAGVGGFRIGLERASRRFKTVWYNQWEPSTKSQDAYSIYKRDFKDDGDEFSNQDINTVPIEEIPDADLLCGGFPCQDYSVATTLKNSRGIEGKKGVLWWNIYNILHDKGEEAPKYLMLENVDRLLGSPARQRGRDFAIILSSLAKLGYIVEWKVINAADYGMPQRRRRTYMVGYRKDSKIYEELNPLLEDPADYILNSGIEAKAFPSVEDLKGGGVVKMKIGTDPAYNTQHFNENARQNQPTPFKDSGVLIGDCCYTMDTLPVYDGPRIVLGDILLDDNEIPEIFFISEKDEKQWSYLKGPKKEKRVSSNGHEYLYSEGGMSFPDSLDKPSRTIITGEGGAGPSRFKHVIRSRQSGRLRRLVPIELERLNMFPDNHTEGASDLRRAFLMGNALVTGIPERLGTVMSKLI